MAQQLPRLGSYADYLALYARTQADADAVWHEGVMWSWRELARQVSAGLGLSRPGLDRQHHENLLPQLGGVVLRLRRPGGEPCRQEQGDAAHHGASSAASSDSASVTPGLARSRANTSPMLPEGAART